MCVENKSQGFYVKVSNNDPCRRLPGQCAYSWVGITPKLGCF